MKIELKPIFSEQSLWGYPSWLWQINEQFTDGSKMVHLYLVDDKAPIKDWYIDDTNQVRKTVISDPNYWDVRPSYNAIICTTDPQLITDGIPSISKEFLKLFVDTQGKGKIMLETVHKKPKGCSLLNCEGMRNKSCDCFDEKWNILKLDNSGNAVLSIVPEETVKSFIDGIANHLGMDRQGALDKIDEFSSNLNELKSLQEPGFTWVNEEVDYTLDKTLNHVPETKQESGIEAVEFPKWLDALRNSNNPIWGDVSIWGKENAYEKLYELYKQSKK